ncbi:MAG: hypothetical protein K2M91_15495 [Lachnospiraceae bacterium]|nr:hypothetical protein [Lachnospiraceae bacterium]
MAFPAERILEDVVYLQQMYPTYAKRYQSVIRSVVDKMDYDSSFIYDQYPDKLTMQRMVESVMAVIRTNEEAANNNDTGMQNDNTMPESTAMPQNNPEMTMMNMETTNMTNRTSTRGALTENAPWHEKEPWIRELVTVLMCYEILTRRRKKNRQWFGNMSSGKYYQF